MWSGYKDKGVPQLPVQLYKTFDTDDVYMVRGDTLYLYLEKPKSPGDFMLTKWQGHDLHIMNKWAINRVSAGLMAYALSENKDTEPFWVIKTPFIPESLPFETVEETEA